jgi:hypothetical protein
MIGLNLFLNRKGREEKENAHLEKEKSFWRERLCYPTPPKHLTNQIPFGNIMQQQSLGKGKNNCFSLLFCSNAGCRT